MLSAVRLISEAAELAARRHNGMARKGAGSEPTSIISRRSRTCWRRRQMAPMPSWSRPGWLHDAIEDTETTREELAQKILGPRCLSRRRMHRRHEPAESRAAAPSGGRCAEEVGWRQADQDCRQDQQYPARAFIPIQPVKSATTRRLHGLGRAGGRRLPRRQFVAGHDIRQRCVRQGFDCKHYPSQTGL